LLRWTVRASKWVTPICPICGEIAGFACISKPDALRHFRHKKRAGEEGSEARAAGAGDAVGPITIEWTMRVPAER